MSQVENRLLSELDHYGPDKWEIMSEIISLACISALAAAMGSKTKGQRWKNLTYGRVLVIALYLFSWGFATVSIVVVSTNNNNIVSCTIGMLTCDVFYAGSKIIIYAWLIERVHLVTSVRTTRLKSCQYRFHLVLLTPYIAIAVLMLTFRNIYLLEDGTCMIGLQLIASIPLIVYDFLLNLYLTFLFVRPLIDIARKSNTSEWKHTRLYKLTVRTMFASLVCLIVSFVNAFFVVYTHGHERGLMCLTMCTVDVTINAVVIHWVTKNTKLRVRRRSIQDGSGDTSDHSGPARQTLEHMTYETSIPTGIVDFQAPYGKYHIAIPHHTGQQDDDSDSLKSSNAPSQCSVKPLHGNL